MSRLRIWFYVFIGWSCLTTVSVVGFVLQSNRIQHQQQQQQQQQSLPTTVLASSSSSSSSSPSPQNNRESFDEQEQDYDDDASIQWELFQKHHARGCWKGIWTTYDYIGDVQDETVASVNLLPSNLEDDDNDDDISDNIAVVVDHSHTIVIGAKRSDCKTCFDSMEQRTFPVARYTRDNLLQRSRLAGISLVNGPSLLRSSGVMATELVLKHGDGRVRVIFNHAPVWAQDVEPGSCPPQGLKLFRVMLSREALRDTAPTADVEREDPPQPGNPIFFRPVPPFHWHKKWSGTSWTWGPQTGNRGWSIDEIEETDAWHGITPVECWNLRLGSIHMQAPKVITPDSVGICRLAWLPDDDTLLRVEAGVSALQQPLPLADDDDDDNNDMIGFEPPRLTSLRCDMLQKTGELDLSERPFRGSSTTSDDQPKDDEEVGRTSNTITNKSDNDDDDDGETETKSDRTTISTATALSAATTVSSSSSTNQNSEPENLRDSLSL
ncbi:hypothetical protein IV203_017857 [Nitzschia inconspicua]|uniref:DUF3598 domain-containing protein n=1 Tax=Nitzschia inconspicua TaxID=303405 RepID=A0A9K3PCG6_9STRA|nr:hypothetical protein IV203_020556 [Nitzschia inconspicua]KAG7371715.1 hypothetical protein IV203_017857 [Nitzschia inconspicua]